MLMCTVVCLCEKAHTLSFPAAGKPTRIHSALVKKSWQVSLKTALQGVWLLQEAPLLSTFPLPACKMDTQLPDVVATGQPLGWEPQAKEAEEAGLWRHCGDSSQFWTPI